MNKQGFNRRKQLVGVEDEYLCYRSRRREPLGDKSKHLATGFVELD